MSLPLFAGIQTEIHLEQYPPPFIYFSSFFESRQMAPKKGQKTERHNSHRQKNLTPPKLRRPSPVVFEAGLESEWTLQCVCQNKGSEGLLLFCETCKTWQHAICMGYNIHTVPEEYQCDRCSKILLRCKCEENLNFQFQRIQCSICKFYVHKRCEGLGFGMMPRGEFVCHFCGRFRPVFDKPCLRRVKLPDKSVTFSSGLIDRLPEPIRNGPFLSIFGECNDATFKSKDFVELFYDTFRSFFFISHQLAPNHTSKKKRNSLHVSFINASLFLLDHLFKIPKNVSVDAFEELILADIYVEHDYSNLGEMENELLLTENVLIDLSRNTDFVKFQVLPDPIELVFENGNLFCVNDIPADQLLFICDGLIADIEEFDFQGKVDSSLFLIHGTRYVLDASRNPQAKIHLLKRKMNANCSLKIFYANNRTFCGIFSTKSSISPLNATDPPFDIPARSTLSIAIDFLPAMLDDLSKYHGWRWIEPDPPKEESKPKPKQKEIKKKRTKKKIEPDLPPSTLYSLMNFDSPGDFLFLIGNSNPPPQLVSRTFSSEILTVQPEVVTHMNPLIEEEINAQFQSLSFNAYLPPDVYKEVQQLLNS